MLDRRGRGRPAVGPERLHRWLNGDRRLEKPPLPERRGATTIGDLPQDSDSAVWAAAVRVWADDVWSAYSPLHPLARTWAAEAGRG